MTDRQYGHVSRREVAGWCLTLGVVTVAMIAVRSHLNAAHVALVYLLVVQLASARGGRPLGIAMASASFVLFDWFFLPPFGTFALDNPLNWLVLGGFFATSVVSAHLLYRARSEAEAAQYEADRVAVLQEAERAKDAVLSAVSHDLRTPLTTIKALAHDLAVAGDERAMIIEEEADRLNRFVSDLLDLSRIESGMALDLQANEVEDLVGVALQQSVGRLGQHRVHFVRQSTDPLLIGRFDFTQTLRALVNLLENAAKYSPPNTAIELTTRREHHCISLTVADRGPGVPEEDRERIFEPFFRRQSGPPDAGGAGLGLAIARALIECQGGTLTYAGREGGGSLFTLSVPALDLADLTSPS